jgi:hypothetical protein
VGVGALVRRDELPVLGGRLVSAPPVDRLPGKPEAVVTAIVACPFCDGKGHKAEVPCDVCHGVGRVSPPGPQPKPETMARVRHLAREAEDALYPHGLRGVVADPFLGRPTVPVDAAVLEEIFALADDLPTRAWLEMMADRLKAFTGRDKHGESVPIDGVLRAVAELDELIERLNYRARQGRRDPNRGAEEIRLSVGTVRFAPGGRRP